MAITCNELEHKSQPTSHTIRYKLVAGNSWLSERSKCEQHDRRIHSSVKFSTASESEPASVQRHRLSVALLL